eukprot:scaffold120806_cov44-Prasinocladus_malaysianus.AAC.1
MRGLNSGNFRYQQQKGLAKVRTVEQMSAGPAAMLNRTVHFVRLRFQAYDGCAVAWTQATMSQTYYMIDPATSRSGSFIVPDLLKNVQTVTEN